MEPEASRSAAWLVEVILNPKISQKNRENTLGVTQPPANINIAGNLNAFVT